MFTYRRLSGAAAIGLTAALTGALAAPSFAAPTDEPADATTTEAAESAAAESADVEAPAQNEDDGGDGGDDTGEDNGDDGEGGDDGGEDGEADGDDTGDDEEDGEDEGDYAFEDNLPGSAFYAPVQWMAENGISVGYADGTFKKTRDVSRGETAAFLYRYLAPEGFEAPEVSPFSDVNAGGAFFESITFAAELEITVGYADGTFKPSTSVTRGQFAAFLYRLAEPDHTAPETSPFEDLNPDGANFEAITWLASEAITVGDTQGNFNQSDEITRGEISAFMERFDAADW